MKREVLMTLALTFICAAILAVPLIAPPEETLTLENQTRLAASRVDVPGGATPKPEFEISPQALPGNPYYQRVTSSFYENINGREALCSEISDYRSYVIYCVDTGRKWVTR